MGDAYIVRRGGGGVSLNYKVVGGTSQPSNASENTIWVNTSTAITSHVFSATESEKPAEGMVWFNIGTSCTAPINVLKKNTLMVYPTAVQQYVSGAWVAKEAKTYQSGAWVDWIFYLYNSGNIMEGITGGWTAEQRSWHPTAPDTSAPTIDYGTDSMVITHKPSYASGCIVYINNAINLTDYSTLKIEGIFDVNRVTNFLGIWKDMSFGHTDGSSVAKLQLSDLTDIAELDISSLSGEHYIGFGFYNIASTPLTITINTMSLLK